MGSASIRIKKRKRALQTINELLNNSGNLLIIHYSCESFYDIKDGHTPRITSIAVRYYKTAQTKSFSIHKIAERKGKLNEVETYYDQLEKEMLKEFFEFVTQHMQYNWVHWNMRDINYGFEAIENRYQVLGGKPTHIDDSKKFDLARLLVDMYGLRYIGHPRLEKLIEKNGIGKKDFLAGAEEANCFEKKEFVRLHQSTLRKVDILNTILEKIEDGVLKTNAKLREIYGLSPQGIFEMVKDNWFLSIAVSTFTLILGGIIGAYIAKMWK